MATEDSMNIAPKTIAQDTQTVSQRWVDTPYYNAAEGLAQSQWRKTILPFLEGVDVDFSHTVELACGHGRMTAQALPAAQTYIGVDVLAENIAFCKERLAGEPKLTLIQNDGVSLASLQNESASFFFCWDSMVHFDSDVVRLYLRELARVLKPGAHAFLHHSNFTRHPGGDFQKVAHARNFMSRELFAHYAAKEGLKVIKAKVIDWGQGERRMPAHDCLSLVERPTG